MLGEGGKLVFSGEVCLFKAVSFCKMVNFLRYSLPSKVVAAFFDTLCLCQMASPVEVIWKAVAGDGRNIVSPLHCAVRIICFPHCYKGNRKRFLPTPNLWNWSYEVVWRRPGKILLGVVWCFVRPAILITPPSYLHKTFIWWLISVEAGINKQAIQIRFYCISKLDSLDSHRHTQSTCNPGECWV